MRLKQLRKKAKLNLTDIANIVGVSYQTISNWEKGATEPDIQSLKKLSSFFNVTIDYLLEHDDIELYMKEMFKKLETLDKEQLMTITKSMIENLLETIHNFPELTIEDQ